VNAAEAENAYGEKYSSQEALELNGCLATYHMLASESVTGRTDVGMSQAAPAHIRRVVQ